MLVHAGKMTVQKACRVGSAFQVGPRWCCALAGASHQSALRLIAADWLTAEWATARAVHDSSHERLPWALFRPMTTVSISCAIPRQSLSEKKWGRDYFLLLLFFSPTTLSLPRECVGVGLADVFWDFFWVVTITEAGGSQRRTHPLVMSFRHYNNFSHMTTLKWRMMHG